CAAGADRRLVEHGETDHDDKQLRTIIPVVPAKAGTQSEQPAYEAKATMRLHSRQPEKRYPLHRRDQQRRAEDMAASHRSGRRVHEKLSRAHACLSRIPRHDGSSDHPRKATQEMAPSMEVATDRAR